MEDTRLEAKAKDTKKSKAKAKDSLSEDRHSRGQGQECSRPRTGMLEAKDQGHKRKCSPKKRSSQKFFKRSPQKNVCKKIFQALPQNFNNSKNSAVLEPRTGQLTRTWGPRGQGQGLDLRGQGQGLQNVSSRTSSRPRTSSRTPPLLSSFYR